MPDNRRSEVWSVGSALFLVPIIYFLSSGVLAIGHLWQGYFSQGFLLEEGASAAASETGAVAGLLAPRLLYATILFRVGSLRSISTATDIGMSCSCSVLASLLPISMPTAWHRPVS